MLIAQEEPPSLEEKELWSASFLSFVQGCLTKDPQQRLAASALLQTPFVRSADLFCPPGLLSLYQEKVMQEREQNEDKNIEKYALGIKRISRAQVSTFEHFDFI